MFIKKSLGKKNQSISCKHGDCKIILKLVRKSIFEQTYTFCVIIWTFLIDMIKTYNEKVISLCFVFLIMLHL